MPFPRISALCALLGLVSACSEKKAPAPAAPPALRVSMIPTTDPGKAERESQPLVDYLGKAVGRPIALTVPTNYAAVVEALVNDQVDVAYLGGFTYVQASSRAGVVPLVQRDRDQDFHSVFVTQPGSPIRGLADLGGHSFAFGDVNSTSGHLMPESFMREAKVAPEVIEKAIYTGGHDATLLAVANGKVDAGALDEAVFQRMTGQGKVAPDKVRVFLRSPPFFDYVWAARKGLDPAAAAAFSRAFLELTPADPPRKAILDLLSAARYVKAQDASYDKLRQVARQAGLLK
ncbi:MAG: putative selenate ABC transporter substrate-binding protein [Myxococcales bacterium]